MQTTPTSILGAVAVTAALGGVAWLSSQRPVPEVDAPARVAYSEDSQESQLKIRLTRLEKQLRRAEAVTKRNTVALAVAQKPASVQAETPSVDSSATAPKSVLEQMREERTRAVARQQAADAQLAREDADQTWQSEVMAELTQALEQTDRTLFPTATLASVNCGRTLCRLVYEYGSPEERMAFEDSGAFRFSSAGHIFGRQSEGDTAGTYETYVYAARRGSHLPALTE